MVVRDRMLVDEWWLMVDRDRVLVDVNLAKQELLNKLNVYPVPDGDTGTNMVLTLRSAVDCLEQKKCELPELTRSLSDGALLGARGNSGVILSQIIRGFADTIKKRIDI